jgi:hypothetical protein
MANYPNRPYRKDYNSTPYPMRTNQQTTQTYFKKSGASIRGMVTWGWRKDSKLGLMKFVGSPKLNDRKVKNPTGEIYSELVVSNGETNLYHHKGKYFVLFTIWIQFQDGRKVPTNGILTGFSSDGSFNEKDARLRMPEMNLIASFSSYGHTRSGKPARGFWGKVSNR